ncbi:MAG: hypothetical protein AB7J28_04695 [Hyphomonadaceae bacterium]
MRKFLAAAIVGAALLVPAASAQNQDAPPTALLTAMHRACTLNGNTPGECSCMAGYMVGLLTDQELYVLEPALGAMTEGRDINDEEMQGVMSRLMGMGLPAEEMRALGQSLQTKGARMQAESARVEALCQAL